MLTKEEYLFALENELMEFDEIPNSIINDEFYMDMVSINGVLLRYVPLEKRTKELCEKAIQNKFDAIESIPEKFKNKDLFMLGIKDNYDKLTPANIPKRILYEIKLELIKQAYIDSKKYDDSTYAGPNYENKEKIKKLSKVLIKIKDEKR